VSERKPEANPWDTVQDIEDALDDYVQAHPGWQTQPSGAVVEEVSLLIHRLYNAASRGVPQERRRKAPQPPERKFGPNDIPF
jgi:hypothetical protein